MTDDHDDLDLALAALPLEEPPARLRARILASTVYAPPAPAVASWEPWLIGVFAALLAWAGFLAIRSPQVGAAITDAVARATEPGGLLSVGALIWWAIGGSAALWISQLSVPLPRRARRGSR